MNARAEDESFELVDLAGVSLSDLLRQGDSAFTHCLRRIVADNDDADALTVVAFESHAA